MKSVAAENLLKQIDQAITDINSFSSASLQEKSYLAKFLVVFISGIFEEAIETIINEKISTLHSLEVSKFVESSVEFTFRNPRIANVTQLLKKFNDSWGATIIQMPDNSKIALNNIVENKDGLAHGGGCNVTLSEVYQYYQDSRLIIEKIDEIVL